MESRGKHPTGGDPAFNLLHLGTVLVMDTEDCVWKIMQVGNQEALGNEHTGGPNLAAPSKVLEWPVT